MSIKDEWIEDRVEELRKLPAVALVNVAGDRGVRFDDRTTQREIARRIAIHEWKVGVMRRAVAKRLLPPFEAKTDDYPRADVTGVPFEDAAQNLFGTPGPDELVLDDDFNAMEPGPMEEPDPAVTKLKREIMQRWIGVIGGMEWYNGPNGGAAQSHGRALAAVLDAVLHGGVVRGSNPYGIQTTSGWFIYEVVLPDVLRHFFKDNADYGDNHREGLGLRAEFVGVHRKVKKLQKAIWDGENMNGEGAEEMLTDLIGQCLIMLDLIQSGKQP